MVALVVEKKSHEHSPKKKKLREKRENEKKHNREKENRRKTLRNEYFSSTNKKVKKKDCSFAKTFGAAKDCCSF